MARQLTLLDTPPSWRLDEATKEAGRKGIAEARARLREAAMGSRAKPEQPSSPDQRRSAA